MKDQQCQALNTWYFTSFQETAMSDMCHLQMSPTELRIPQPARPCPVLWVLFLKDRKECTALSVQQRIVSIIDMIHSTFQHQLTNFKK